MTAHEMATAIGLRRDTANDRFKESFGNWLWGSMIAATVAHFLVFAFMPDMRADDVSFAMDDMEAIDIPLEIDIPPPPEAIQRPARPVISDVAIETDITIPSTNFDDNPPERLNRPTATTSSASETGPVFTPVEVPPKLLNDREVERALQREYPPLLEQARIGGTVRVWFYIDETGKVIDSQVQESSGHPKMDEAALKVASLARFAPAKNRDKNVALWIALPVEFRVAR